MTPFESKVKSNGVGALGLQINCEIAPVEMKNAWFTDPLTAGPVDGNR
jgi:hypothetical protein